MLTRKWIFSLVILGFDNWAMAPDIFMLMQTWGDSGDGSSNLISITHVGDPDCVPRTSALAQPVPGPAESQLWLSVNFGEQTRDGAVFLFLSCFFSQREHTSSKSFRFLLKISVVLRNEFSREITSTYCLDASIRYTLPKQRCSGPQQLN